MSIKGQQKSEGPTYFGNRNLEGWMTIVELYRDQLEREARITRPVLERVPEDKADWKPHEKSMPLGYLSILVAQLPSWLALTINQEEFDLQPPAGKSKFQTKAPETNAELLQLFDKSVADGRDALAKTTVEHLMKPWKLLVAGKVVSDQPRHMVISDAVFSHLAHHRGQLTVYLRLNGAKIPSIYGPTADDPRF
jgi:uncharacterized damage-inducible protein DinB